MFNRKDVFTIPNILGYFRILLIPCFVYKYMTATSLSDYYAAAILVGVSSITDMFDGLIARKYNMITELGKLLDPLADKLTQCALLICLLRYKFMYYLLALFVVKESFMAIMGLVMLKHNGKKLNGAKWFGKVSTALVYVVMFILFLKPIFFSQMQEQTVNLLILTCGVAMLATLVLYIPVFSKMYLED